MNLIDLPIVTSDEIKKLPVMYIRKKRSFKTESKNQIKMEIKNYETMTSCKIIHNDCQSVFELIDQVVKKSDKSVNDIEQHLKKLNLGEENKKPLNEIFRCIKCRDIENNIKTSSPPAPPISCDKTNDIESKKKLKSYENKNKIRNVDYNDSPERYDIPIVQETNIDDDKNSVTSLQDEKAFIRSNNEYSSSPKPLNQNQQTKYPTTPLPDGSGKTPETCVPVNFYPPSQKEPQYPSPIFLQPKYNSLSPNNYQNTVQIYQQLSPQYARDEQSIKLEYRYPPSPSGYLPSSTQEYPPIQGYPQPSIQGYPQQSIQGHPQQPMQGYFNLGQPSALYLCSYVKPAYPINTGFDNQRQYNNQEENFVHDKIKDRAEAYAPSIFVNGSNKSSMLNFIFKINCLII